MTKPAKPYLSFSARERFNWGYHDGAAHRERGKSAAWYAPNKPHPDRAYGDGYSAGYNDAARGEYRMDSTAAWNARKAAA